jgi:hypothetical protein
MTDYYTHVYVGVAVTEDDFLVETKEDVVLCSHPEARGQKFCPVCGKRDDQRTVVKGVKTWKPNVLPAIEALCKEWGIDLGDLGGWGGLVGEYEASIGGLGIHDIRTSSEDREPLYILGETLFNIPGEGGQSGVESVGTGRIGEIAEDIRGKVRELGLEGVVRVFATCYVSV